MAFFLFMLVNATLFLRPAEIFPELAGLPIYEVLIVGCFLFAIPEILSQFSLRPIDAQPITFCVFGIFGAVVFSQVVQLNWDAAWQTGVMFFKVVIYYMLAVSLLNTPFRLRVFLYWLVIFGIVLAVVTLLQYHEVIQLPTLKPLPDTKLDPITAQPIEFMRLQGSGIFQDPNEFCLILAVCVPLCLYQMSKGGQSVSRGYGQESMDLVGYGAVAISRLVWLIPLAVFGYAIALTHSRGGFLALLGGLGAVIWARYGWRRAVGLACLGLPVLLIAFAGRQTEFSATKGTAQSRVQIWSDWLFDVRSNPVFGKGMKLSDEKDKHKFGMERQHVAHNSYLHSFAELGLIGGMFFLGAFYLAWNTVRRYHAEPVAVLDPQMKQLQPYLFGALTAYAVGLLSLSLCYVVPTYLFLAMAVSFRETTPTMPESKTTRIDGPVLGRLAVVSIGFLAFTYVFVRVFIRWT